MSALTLSSDGSLTIPASLTQALGLGTGDAVKVQVSPAQRQIVVEPDKPAASRLVFDEKLGRHVLVAPPGAPEMTPELIKAILCDEA